MATDPEQPPVSGVDMMAMLERLKNGEVLNPQELTGATPGLGTTDAESAFYTVYLGHNPSPPVGPATHADVADPTSKYGKKDRGPRMHEDLQPVNKPWPEYDSSHDYVPDKTVPIDDALAMIYKPNIEKKFVELLLREGVIEEGDFSIDDVHQWWDKAVTESAKMTKFGGHNTSPYDYIEMYAGVNGLGSGGDGAGASHTSTSTDTSVEHFTDLDARAMAEDKYSELLGRRPKGKEAEAVKEMLNAYAKAHPSISTRTTTTDGDGNSTSTSSSKGGITAPAVGQLIEDGARGNKHYGEYQAATTYFNALQQALGATANV